MIKLFLIGMAMGVADMIPGISSATVAYLTGIYHSWLVGIQSLQLHDLRKVHWRFLAPLGLGMATSFLLFAKLLIILLTSSLLFAFFLGLIVASAYFCFRRASPSYVALVLGAAVAYFVASPSLHLTGGCSFFWLFFCGFLASAAMLLPGISGCYVLSILGAYPIAIQSLANITEGWSLLLPIFFGVLLGVILFSRLVTWLLSAFPSGTPSFLTGLMVGGCRSVWPFGGDGNTFLCLALVLIGFVTAILLELKGSRTKYKVFY